MSRLRYSVLVSLDGYVNDASGGFDWAAPDSEVHAFVNDQERAVGTYLYGRRLYEIMTYWETALEQQDVSEVERDYAQVWQSADKIVYSSTLAEPSTARTRIVPTFDPDTVRRLKDEADADLSIGGPELAGQAIVAGLVDDIGLYLAPVAVGGGGRFFWPPGVRQDLQLVFERRFRSGTVYLHYRTGGEFR